MQSVYGSLLWWLRGRGDLDPDAGPRERLNCERLVAYLAERGASASPNTLFNNLRMLALTLNCLAPDQNWNWICRHAMAPRKHEAVSARRKVRVVDPVAMHSGLLMRLEAMAEVSPTRETAIRLRDLLIVAVCAATALRLGNLLGLAIGSSIFRYAGGFEIRLAAEQVKNRQQIVMRLPAMIVPHLDRYISGFRPILLASGAEPRDALWLNRKGASISRAGADLVFKRITIEILGRPVNPHSFRHNAATKLLRLDPRARDVAAALLAHKDPTTTDEHYDLSDDEASWSHWAGLIAKYLPVDRKNPRKKRRE